jgi:hypothetical protein
MKITRTKTAGRTLADRKLAELILYIADRCADARMFGKVKLNKILFYADFLYYKKTGHPITGQEYMRLDQGPGPRRLLPVMTKMLEAGRLALKRERVFDRVQERPIALEEADLSDFAGDQIAMVDDIIAALWDKTGREVSLLSHALVGWQIVGDRETIPYSTIFLSDRSLTDAEMEHGLQLADELGLPETPDDRRLTALLRRA